MLQRGSKGLSEGRKRAKNGEAKPKPQHIWRKIASGRPLEVLDPVGVLLVRALPAISA